MSTVQLHQFMLTLPCGAISTFFPYIGNYSPMGRLLLHWVTNMILIASAAAIPNVGEAINMPGYLQTYSHALIQCTHHAKCA